MIVENYEKLFTKKQSNNIMREKYNLLNKDYEKSYEREGLCMEETKDVILNNILKSRELNLKDKIIIKLFPKTFIKVYEIARKKTFNNIYTM